MLTNKDFTVKSERTYTVKDSGQREEYASGMRRDTQEGKPDYALIHPTFLTRLAMHLTRGAKKYGRHNWQLANSQAELIRFQSSAFRHLIQWLCGDEDEDHASAVCFNIMAGEYVKQRLMDEGEPQQDETKYFTVFRMDGQVIHMTSTDIITLTEQERAEIHFAIPGRQDRYMFVDGNWKKL